MHPLLTVVAATAVCALARPPDLPRRAVLTPYALAELERERARLLGGEWRGDDPAVGRLLPGPISRPIDWLSEEIARLSLKEYDDYERDREQQLSNQRIPFLAPEYNPEPIAEYEYLDHHPQKTPFVQHYMPKAYREPSAANEETVETKVDQKRKEFAFTPLDKDFFQNAEESIARPRIPTIAPLQKIQNADMVFEEPRKTRQNPNLSKTKTLIAENLDKLRAGTLGTEREPTEAPRLALRPEPVPGPDSVYGVALMAAVGAALSVAVLGFGFGWYTLSKKAKAAAEVDYPAYGVTGPAADASGDRKLAHSAHMYHYQHQKQQILAMERNGVDQRNGSVSDPESEEENEEGDYTVYEWPGFATTGDMEVKNPLFSDDPTPATPCKIEVVKPQPKD